MNYSSKARSAGKRAKLSMLLCGLACALAAGTAGAAVAADADVPSMTLKYSQLSLATDAGVRDLYRRITYAAAKVCPDVSMRQLIVNRAVAQCRSAAIERAISQIDNPRLAALHGTRSRIG